jgi:hypothetical protein
MVGVELIDHILAARGSDQTAERGHRAGRRRGTLAAIDRPTAAAYLAAVLVVVQRHVLALLRGIGRIRLEREP